MKFRIIISGVLWSFLNHTATRGSLLFASVILSRDFQQENFSEYAYFQLTATMIATVSAMGLGATASKFFSELKYADKNPPIGLFWWLSLALSFLTAVAFFFLPNEWILGDLSTPKLLYSVGVFVFSLGVVPAAAIIGLERHRVGAISSGAIAVLFVIAILFSSSAVNPVLAICFLITASFIQAIIQTVVVIREISWLKVMQTSSFDVSEVRKMIYVVGPMFFVTLMAASGTWLLGRFILNSENGRQEFAFYSIGLQWFSLSLLFPGILAKVLMPRLVADIGNRIKLTWLGALAAIIISFIIFSLGFYVDSWIVKMYGEKNKLPSYLISSYLAAAIVVAPINIMGSLFLTENLQKIWLILTFFWFVSLVAIWVFVAYLGFLLPSFIGSLALGGSYGVFFLMASVVFRCKYSNA